MASGSAVTGADNGLTVGYNSTGKIGLGGTLAKATNVALGGNTLAITGSYAGANFQANGNLSLGDAFGKAITLDMSSNTANTDPMLSFKPYGATNYARIGTSGSPLAIVTQGTSQATDATALTLRCTSATRATWVAAPSRQCSAPVFQCLHG